MEENRECTKGDVLRIRPKRGKRTWCRHDIVIFSGEKWVDTYWSDGTAAYTWEQLEKRAKEIVDLHQNMADMEPIPRHDVYENSLVLYRARDVLFIPMGGTGERSYVRKCAEPVPCRVVRRLQVARYEKMWESRRALEEAMEMDRYVKYLRESARELEQEGNGEA